LENFLVSSNYEIKLCDFGSATQIIYEPDNSWSANKRNLIEDEIAKQTTPMYRAPEMLDLYSNYKIDFKVDVWALGCVLYLLCFHRHPFEDGAKLRIINGKYQIPSADKEFTDLHDLIRCMLNTDPARRPSLSEILFHLENIAQTRSIQLAESLKFLKKTELSFSPPQQTAVPQQAVNSEPRANNINANAAAGGATNANWMGNAAGLFKGNSLFKTIKDASSKVMDTVHQ
jgi:cyclin G-associated kinase